MRNAFRPPAIACRLIIPAPDIAVPTGRGGVTA
jgi:hypothetical protein